MSKKVLAFKGIKKKNQNKNAKNIIKRERGKKTLTN